MAELVPYPFAALARRMLRELERSDAVFDLPAKKFFLGDPVRDLTVRFHHHRPSSPLGPAAGPHTQMAQNIVLSWLGGGRVMELKTVQILDELTIPRPCIDMRTVGFNAEWSQELKLEQSLVEYVKAAMLIEILQASGAVVPEEGFREVVYDLSVGYDLEGIRSERVDAFIRGMMDARETVDLLRRELTGELAGFRGLDFPTRLADTVTLSTFHGCPPEEIERIIDHLMREYGLACVVKFNPMLLGAEEARGLLHDVLGYHDLSVPDSAFERDATWEQAVAFVERLAETAGELGLTLGAKFSNTLIVENTAGFLPPEEAEVYLSGPPLHVLAVHLVRRFRRRFGDRFGISFAAGIDRGNFAEAVALGLVPITVCSDLLQPGGYGRLSTYQQRLGQRMAEAGATTTGDFVLRAFGQGAQALSTLDPGPPSEVRQRCLDALADGGDLRAAAGDGELYARWISAAVLLNTERYAEAATADPRYRRERHQRPPRKIDSRLELFDCITCDKCIPVCPNDAIFTYLPPAEEIPVVQARREAGGWRTRRNGTLPLHERHQIGVFADFCNECGNCDIFCPEHGGPYLLKPRFFSSRASFRDQPHLDGFYLERREGRDLALGRFEGRAFRLEIVGGEGRYSGDDFELTFDLEAPETSLTGHGPEEVDLTWGLILDALRRGVLDSEEINHVNALQPSELAE